MNGKINNNRKLAKMGKCLVMVTMVDFCLKNFYWSITETRYLVYKVVPFDVDQQ